MYVHPHTYTDRHTEQWVESTVIDRPIYGIYGEKVNELLYNPIHNHLYTCKQLFNVYLGCRLVFDGEKQKNLVFGKSGNQLVGSQCAVV